MDKIPGSSQILLIYLLTFVFFPIFWQIKSESKLFVSLAQLLTGLFLHTVYHNKAFFTINYSLITLSTNYALWNTFTSGGGWIRIHIKIDFSDSLYDRRSVLSRLFVTGQRQQFLDQSSPDLNSMWKAFAWVYCVGAIRMLQLQASTEKIVILLTVRYFSTLFSTESFNTLDNFSWIYFTWL